MGPTIQIQQESRIGMLGACLLVLLFFFQSLGAQHYTYIGGGISLYTPHLSGTTVPDLVKAPFDINGGAYDVTVRQEINHFLSIETGISAHNLEHEYLFKDEVYVYTGHFPIHKIPLIAEAEVDIFMDRIIAYASFGIQFCIRNSSTSGNLVSAYFEKGGGRVDVTWDYISDSQVYSLFQVGTGSRFRLVDQLLFELEIGYAFSLKEMVEADITYMDQTGEEYLYLHKEKLNYWYLQGGLSYPVQRIVQIIRGALNPEPNPD